MKKDKYRLVGALTTAFIACALTYPVNSYADLSFDIGSAGSDYHDFPIGLSDSPYFPDTYFIEDGGSPGYYNWPTFSVGTQSYADYGYDSGSYFDFSPSYSYSVGGGYSVNDYSGGAYIPAAYSAPTYSVGTTYVPNSYDSGIQAPPPSKPVPPYKVGTKYVPNSYEDAAIYGPYWSAPPVYSVGAYSAGSAAPFYNVGAIVQQNYVPQNYQPAQYTFTAPLHGVAPSCSVTISDQGYTNGDIRYDSLRPMLLTWQSAGSIASAYINGVGIVQASGSRVVYPSVGQIFTLTVTGQGGNASCQTNVYYGGITSMPSQYQVPAQYQYGSPIYQQPMTAQAPVQTYYNTQQAVALSQIPYTGFDFGAVGNSIYWIALLAFAASAAYLMIYFRGGAFSLLHSFGRRSQKMPVIAHIAGEPLKAHMPTLKRDFAARETPASLHHEHAHVAAAQRAHADNTNHTSLHDLPVAAAMESVLTTTDTMTVHHSKNGEAPRIIIARA